MTKSNYIIKVSMCDKRGEFTGGKTLAEARLAAKTFVEGCDGDVAIVRFAFGTGLPEDGKLELVETVRSWYDKGIA